MSPRHEHYPIKFYGNFVESLKWLKDFIHKIITTVSMIMYNSICEQGLLPAIVFQTQKTFTQYFIKQFSNSTLTNLTTKIYILIYL